MNVLSNYWTVQLTSQPDVPVDGRHQLTRQAGNPVDRNGQLTHDYCMVNETAWSVQ